MKVGTEHHSNSIISVMIKAELHINRKWLYTALKSQKTDETAPCFNHLYRTILFTILYPECTYQANQIEDQNSHYQEHQL